MLSWNTAQVFDEIHLIYYSHKCNNTRSSAYPMGHLAKLASESKRPLGGSRVSCTICKSSAPHPRQVTMPAPNHSFITGWMVIRRAKQVKVIKANDNSIQYTVTYVWCDDEVSWCLTSPFSTNIWLYQWLKVTGGELSLSIIGRPAIY